MSTLSEALAPRSDQLNSDDLISGPRTITLTGGRIIKDGRDTKLVLNFDGDNGKPWKPCKTMGRAMVLVWGLTDDNFADKIVGKSVRLYRDPEVKFGDQGAVGGIRISHMSDISAPKTVKLTVSQGKKSNLVFQPLPKAVGGTVRQTPEEWVSAHLEAIDDAVETEDLDAVEKAGAKALVKLEREHPDLHAQVIHAYSVRRSALSVEGKPETDKGEAFSEDGGFGD